MAEIRTYYEYDWIDIVRNCSRCSEVWKYNYEIGTQVQKWADMLTPDPDKKGFNEVANIHQARLNYYNSNQPANVGIICPRCGGLAIETVNHYFKDGFIEFFKKSIHLSLCQYLLYVFFSFALIHLIIWGILSTNGISFSYYFFYNTGLYMSGLNAIILLAPIILLFIRDRNLKFSISKLDEDYAKRLVEIHSSKNNGQLLIIDELEASSSLMDYFSLLKKSTNVPGKKLHLLLFLPLILIALILVAGLWAKEKRAKSPEIQFLDERRLGSFSDSRDGKEYKTIQIGNQTWMAENLAYLPSINKVTDGSEDAAGSYYYVYGYNGTDITTAKATPNYTTYGVLYNWYAAMYGSSSSTSNPIGIQGVCPTGWHLPSNAEWTQLTDYLGGTVFAGGKLKEAGTTHWNSPNTGATNETGFTALPGGYRSFNDTFFEVGNNGYWWTATEGSATIAALRFMSSDISSAASSFSKKEMGFSVRCIRN